MNLTKLESPGLYHVGWIAALPLERTAALLMLDEEHRAPANFEHSSNDPNSYTWGRIGEHNVVIASLKAGVYGIVSAAITAQNMLSSFPNVRIGLLVAIGAGIARPDKGRDIRLGDVVVSQPSGANGGVIQYDLVKARGTRFERRGFLNKPPALLLNTLSKVQSEHEIPGKSQVPEILDGVLKDCPELLKREGGFFYQGFENDKLFKSTYGHVEGADCSKCDATEKVKRSPRGSTTPEIHYGTIASGDILMKDAALRDWVIEQLQLEDCLCFEMEAAGLMNNFPCLVIRGICDYGDSHKNDRWQRYAAAAAAAYAKEFLRYIQGTEMEKTEKAMDIMNRGQFPGNEVELALHPAESGLLQNLEMPLDRGAGIGVQDKGVQTSLHLAAQSFSQQSMKIPLHAKKPHTSCEYP
ncbi:purine and uridine phosphorylase [Penicillium canescens]|nr:purine and uridine phosphorylase [Penicillium canescens]